MSQTLNSAFHSQAKACTSLGSPFMGRLLTILAETWPEDTALAAKCATFTGDIGPAGASLPLRICGGLHALVLSAQDPALQRVYPPNDVSDDVLTETVLEALARNEAFLLDWIDNAPQTNEVRRSAALIPAAHYIAARHPLPMMMSELGASAGLNMCWDRFALQADGQRLGPEDAALTLSPDWDGPVPAQQPITVTQKRGVDLNPLDAKDPEQALRLLSYLWPDQPFRQDLTRTAIDLLDVRPDQGDAVDWLEDRLKDQPEGQLHLIYHTVAWQYFPQDKQDKGTRLIDAAGEQATDTRPLAWLRMEADGRRDGAALTLRLWPGNETVHLGRVCFHGRWVRWMA